MLADQRVLDLGGEATSRKPRKLAPERSIIIPMRLRTLTFDSSGFLNDTREFDQYIAYGTIRGNMQQIHIRGGGPNRVVQRQKNAFKSVIEN